jgi:hypothetical protein
MIDMKSVMESIARHQEALAKAWKVNREVLFAALSAAQITHIRASFDGGGDSGQIDSIAAYRHDESVPFPEGVITLRKVNRNCEAAMEEKSLEAGIETLCYDFLEQEHGGWENNDGAYGEFTFDVAAQTVELEFNGRYMEVHSTSHTF